jgi:hypothetical protein
MQVFLGHSSVKRQLQCGCESSIWLGECVGRVRWRAQLCVIALLSRCLVGGRKVKSLVNVDS